MNTFFDPLQKANLIKDGEVNLRTLASTPLTSLLDAVDQVAASTAELPQLRKDSSFSHCASIPMGGGLGECNARRCRIERADELARFAALYSDFVYFHNFFADTAPSFSHPPDQDDEEVRRRIATDLEVLLYLRPLIEAGLLVPYSTPHTYCVGCFAKLTIGEEAGHRVNKALKTMSTELLDDMSLELEYADGEFLTRFRSPKRISGHETAIFTYTDPPSAIESRPRILERILLGQRVTVSKTLTKELAIHKHEASKLLYSAIYQMAVAETSGASFLTHRQVEIDMLRAISADDDIRERNTVLESNLTSIVPFVSDVPIAKLAQLRHREEDAFVRYRAALRELTSEVGNEGEYLSHSTARQMYVDILAPEISRLNQSVEEAKRGLVRTPLVSTVCFTAAIGLGLYTGLLSTELAAIGKTLGLGKVTLDTVTKATELTDTTRDIRQEKFYYLWKIQQSSRR